MDQIKRRDAGIAYIADKEVMEQQKRARKLTQELNTVDRGFFLFFFLASARFAASSALFFFILKNVPLSNAIHPITSTAITIQYHI